MATLVRKHAVSAGEIDKLDAAEVYSDLTVTAVRTGEGKLKVIVWQVVGEELKRVSSATAGPVSSVAITFVGYRRVATACRDASGELSIIVWDVTEAGQISQADTASAGPIGSVAPLGVGKQLLVTTVTDSEGNLKVITWSISDSGQITLCEAASGGAASNLAVAYLDLTHIATAFRDSDGNLKLITWEIQSNGKPVRKGEAVAGPVSDLDLFRHAESASIDSQVLFTSARGAGGEIELIAWRCAFAGPIERLGEMTLESGGKPKLTHVGFTRHAVAFEDKAGNLRISCFSWGVKASPTNPKIPDGEGFELLEQASAGEVSAVAAVHPVESGLVTAVRDSDHDLKLILWKLAP